MRSHINFYFIEIMREFLKKMPMDKFQIHKGKNRIKMDKFLSFLTVKTKRGSGHLGCELGWTRHYGENNLNICGGFIQKIEYLDSIQYGNKLDNPWNNYVNPFYLFDIMTKKGKDFFLDYYSEEINKELMNAEKRLQEAQDHKNELFDFWRKMTFELK